MADISLALRLPLVNFRRLPLVPYPRDLLLAIAAADLSQPGLLKSFRRDRGISFLSLANTPTPRHTDTDTTDKNDGALRERTPKAFAQGESTDRPTD